MLKQSDESPVKKQKNIRSKLEDVICEYFEGDIRESAFAIQGDMVRLKMMI